MIFTAPRKSIVDSLIHCADVARRGTSGLSQAVRILVKPPMARGQQPGIVSMDAIVPPICVSSVVRHAAISYDGSIAVNCAAMLERVKSQHEGDVRISVSGTMVSIESVGHSRRSTLSGMPAEDFPKLQSRPTQAECRVSASVLLSVVERASVAVYDDQGTGDRAEYAGCYVAPTDGCLEGASFDGYVMCVTQERYAPVAQGAAFFVTRAALKPLETLLSSVGDDEVRVCHDGVRVHLASTAGELQYALPGALNHGLFGIIRSMAATGGLEVDRGALMSAARAISAGSDASFCRTSVKVAGGKMRLSSKTRGGDNEETIDVVGDAEMSFEIDARRMLRGLSTMSGEVVQVGDGGSRNPISFRCGDTLSCVSRMAADEVANAA